ncbi:DUF1345 domain-containing protein [Micromonospora sp. NPDC048930]|uniref:DUF1345 domain-containing protein n=1 Tax=Micromonospora sp. NPDC048930 TaxID=3364261 RepID=UPI00371CEC92
MPKPTTRTMEAAPQTRGRILSTRRALLSLGVGVVGGAITALLGAPELMFLVGWIAATTVILTWVWRISWPQDPSGTERLAEAESRTRSTDSAVLIAAVVSLAAVVEALIHSGGQEDAVTAAAVTLSVVAVVLSWALVNTVFALKYARLYYLDPDGGIDFHQQTPPTYSDFAYMAFTIGMSFAVSDSEPANHRTRRVALGHALLSYAFGTGVLAVAINLVTNLGES